jgi:plasmid stabilization system protein ParE
MIPAKLSPKAERDLEEHCRKIAADNPDAAERVRLTILNTADLLARNPGLGCVIRNVAPRHRMIRWFVVPRFRNYLVFYKPFEDTVVVVRILHAAQDWTRFFPAARHEPTKPTP